MITVAIIEDNRLVREGMTDMLNELPDVKVVLAATSHETAMLRDANPRQIAAYAHQQDDLRPSRFGVSVPPQQLVRWFGQNDSSVRWFGQNDSSASASRPHPPKGVGPLSPIQAIGEENGVH